MVKKYINARINRQLSLGKDWKFACRNGQWLQSMIYCEMVDERYAILNGQL